MKRIKVKLIYFVIPSVFAVVASIFEGISVGVLIPTVKGVIEADFSFLKTVPVLNRVLSAFPAVFENRNSAVFIFLVGLIFFAAVAKNVFQYLATLSTLFQIERFANNLRKSVYERYLSFGKLYFDQNSMGYLHQVLVGCTSGIAGALHTLQDALYSVFTLIVYLAIMLFISWKLTIFVMIVFPVLHYSLKWLIQKIQKTSQSFAESYFRMGKNISNALLCIPLVKAYTWEKKEREYFDSASDHVERFKFSMEKKRSLISPVQEIILLCMILSLVTLVAFFLIRERQGEIAGYLVYFLILRRSMNALGIFNNIQAAFASVSGQTSEIVKVFDDHDKHFVPDGTKEFMGLRHRIEFHRLNFSYPRGVEALKEVSFSIEKGKMTAIVGATGSGKTTLANLLLRFYDHSPGTITFDGIDIREFAIKSLRSKMALVSQETFLVNASLRANLVYGLENPVSDGQLLRVANQARLSELILKLPEGLETEIGDRGVKLSGGEKQRVSIARAMLKGCEILILDEATSSLDSKTETLVQEAIDAVIQDRTAVVIAHRLSTIRRADKVVVIDNGQVVEQGGLQELLEKKGKFYEYWQEQRFDFIPNRSSFLQPQTGRF